MKRILYVVTLVALALAAPLAALKAGDSEAALGGQNCPSTVNATNADGQARQQFKTPDYVYVEGEEFPANSVLEVTVRRRPQGTIVAAGAVISDANGDVGPEFIWDGETPSQGDDEYEVEVQPPAGGARPSTLSDTRTSRRLMTRRSRSATARTPRPTRTS